MTSQLKRVVQRAEQLPEPVQDSLAETLLAQIRQAEADLRLVAQSFGPDWDNDLDAEYDNYEQHFEER
jgi:hypothetical protein